MAHFVLTNGFVSVASVDLSSHVQSVTLEYKSEIIDATCFGTASTRTRVAGLKDWTVTLEFAQDFASSAVDDTLFSLVGTSVALKIRPVNTSIAATNPEYQGSGILETYQPIRGTVTDLATTTCTFQAGGALTRDTTP